MAEKACIIVYPQAYWQSHVLARFHQLPLLQGGFLVVCCQQDPFCPQANEIWKHDIDEAVNSKSRTSSKCGKSGRNALRKVRDFVQAEERYHLSNFEVIKSNRGNGGNMNIRGNMSHPGFDLKNSVLMSSVIMIC